MPSGHEHSDVSLYMEPQPRIVHQILHSASELHKRLACLVESNVLLCSMFAVRKCCCAGEPMFTGTSTMDLSAFVAIAGRERPARQAPTCLMS